ncbi:E3 ubiquitin-protein ligase RING1-like [Hordeum vulgare]|uniref:RING-type domain-containing protein n=1 Tax=Hordeum vulgare subsp. vulgare TaxID=112509 RepID=A0A8I6XYG9_HORVV|nr:E3 ubiquitin-protein ligase RING1-like [Hordeum vulgare]KAI4996994.1 hypothetical protein ZWY2020_052336 [Hordeum vulgare]
MDGPGPYYDAAASEGTRSFSFSMPGGLITQIRIREVNSILHAFIPGARSNGDEDVDLPTYRGDSFGAVPASEEAIAQLEEAAVEETREAECAVCMESFEAGDKIRKMACSHGYHETCIFRWLRTSRACPLCRFPISAAEDH